MRSGPMRFGLKLAVSVALLWLIVQKLDLADLAAKVKTVSPGGALLVVAALLMQSVVASLRWEWIIRVMGHHFPFAAALRAWLIGQFLGQGFPSTIGHDAYRVMSLRGSGIPATAAFEIIVLDRLTGVVALVLLAAATLPLLFHLASDTAPLFPLVLLIGGGMLATVLLLGPFSLPGLLERYPRLTIVSRFRANLRRLVATRHSVAWVLVPALAAHLLSVLAAYVIARDAGTRFGFVQCLAIIPPAILVSLIPLSIAGWGIREGSVVAAALLLGIPAADALLVSIVLGLGFLAVGMIGGLVWLIGGGVRPAPAGGDAARPREASQDG
ncbi:MAG: lysylphosphatidylglycerol synthase transmembrane domain-containing protein [Burkholderiales bacterium]